MDFEYLLNHVFSFYYKLSSPYLAEPNPVGPKLCICTQLRKTKKELKQNQKNRLVSIQINEINMHHRKKSNKPKRTLWQHIKTRLGIQLGI